jgi:TolA-binding protein
MMSRPRVVVLTLGSLGVLAVGALVAHGGARSGDLSRDRRAQAPATPDGPGTTPIAGADAAARPAVLTARDAALLVSEAALMVRLHQLAETNPPLSLELARQGNARFPHSPDAPERAFIVAKSLVDMGRFKEAQQEARQMLKDYPNDPHTLDVERHLLAVPLE